LDETLKLIGAVTLYAAHESATFLFLCMVTVNLEMLLLIANCLAKMTNLKLLPPSSGYENGVVAGYSEIFADFY
jgi:hypothetical protein